MSAPQQQQQIQTVTQERNVGDRQFSNVFDLETNREKSYGTATETEKKLDFIPEPITAVLSSISCFITLCVLLIFPILEVAIGAAFRDQCPLNPYIPTYLVVTGACGMVTIFLILLIIATFIWCIKKESLGASFVTLCLFGIIVLIIFLMSLFLFAWFIAGNVWVFGARSSVDYDNIGSPNYCNRTVYQFAFAMLILSYIIPVLSCCFSCFRTCCSIGQK